MLAAILGELSGQGMLGRSPVFLGGLWEMILNFVTQGSGT